MAPGAPPQLTPLRPDKGVGDVMGVQATGFPGLRAPLGRTQMVDFQRKMVQLGLSTTEPLCL